MAALVQRGLLKTEDVLSKPYVEAKRSFNC